MDTVSIRLEGDPGALALLRGHKNLRSELAKIAVPTLNSVAEIARREVASRAPGSLATTFDVQHQPTPDLWRCILGWPNDGTSDHASRAEYAGYVEWGTGIHTAWEGAPARHDYIRPVRKQALSWESNGHRVMSMTSSGVEPHFFLAKSLPAIMNNLLETAGLMAIQWWEELSA